MRGGHACLLVAWLPNECMAAFSHSGLSIHLALLSATDIVTAGASSKRQRVLLPLRPYPQPWEAREVRLSLLLMVCDAVLQCAMLCYAPHSRLPSLLTCMSSRHIRHTTPCLPPATALKDFVLCSVVVQLLGQGQPLAHAVFAAAADALAAGAAASAASDADAAAQPGKQRSAVACQQRYVQLCAAARVSGGSGAATTGGRQHLDAMLTRLRQQLQQQLAAGGGAEHAISLVQQVLQHAAAGGAPQAALAAALQQQLQAVAPGAPLPPVPAMGDAVDAAPLAQARQLMAAVQQRCGAAAARAITTKLQQTLPTSLGDGVPPVVHATSAGLQQQAWQGPLTLELPAALQPQAAGSGTPPPPVAALAAFGLAGAPAPGGVPFPPLQ